MKCIARSGVIRFASLSASVGRGEGEGEVRGFRRALETKVSERGGKRFMIASSPEAPHANEADFRPKIGDRGHPASNQWSGS